jgi:hypothetical protein
VAIETPRAPAGCHGQSPLVTSGGSRHSSLRLSLLCARALPCCIAKLASVSTGQCALLLLCALRAGLRAVPLSQLGVGPEVSNNMGSLLTRASLGPRWRFTRASMHRFALAHLHTAARHRAFLLTRSAREQRPPTTASAALRPAACPPRAWPLACSLTPQRCRTLAACPPLPTG